MAVPAPFPAVTVLAASLGQEAVPQALEEGVQDGVDATSAAFGVEWGTLFTVLAAFGVTMLAVYLAFQLARVVLHRRRTVREGLARLSTPASVAAGLLAARIWLDVMSQAQPWHGPAAFVLLIALAAAAAWAAWRLVGVVEEGILGKYREAGVEDRRERRIRTQTILLRRILNAAIVVVAVSVVLLGVPQVRSLGAGLLASAGVISVIAGLAVQSTLTNVFAGFQLAFTDSIRVGDVVTMEGVFGTVEEITLSNVVVKLWDGRRMVYPSSHFTTQPFENWTRVGSQVAGVVELDVDWRVPMPALRDRLTQLLESTELWDGRENSMQVTDALGGTVRIRAVVSARNSGDLWDLRCLVREDLVAFLRHEHPEGIVVQRHADDGGAQRHADGGGAQWPGTGADTARDDAVHDDAGPAPEDRAAGPSGHGSGVRDGADREEATRPRTAPLPRVGTASEPGGAEAAAGTREPRPDTVTTPLTAVEGNSAMYTGSITAIERNRELAGPGEEAYAERRARQAEQRGERVRDEPRPSATDED